ncbi:Nucleoporin nup84 [Savitreella phatthalungensis]
MSTLPPSKLRQVFGRSVSGATDIIDLDNDDDHSSMSQSQTRSNTGIRDVNVPVAAVKVKTGEPNGLGIDEDALAVEYELGNEIEEYAEALRAGRGGELFGENGLLAQFYSIGSERVEALADAGEADSGEARAWQLECRTWDLVQRLYLERTRQVPSAADLAVDIDRISNRALERLLYETDSSAAEARLVLDWLRDGAASIPLDGELRGNRWLYTRESIKTRGRTFDKGLGSGDLNANTVSELDPDAPVRQGKRLDDRDLDYERVMLRALFSHIRAGEFAEAAELCRASGDHWRAASMQGFVEHSDPRRDVSFAENGEDEMDGGRIEGNPRKALWRRMCYALAKETSIDLHERAVYGALCGDVDAVRPACTSWEDHLWAHLNAATQRRLELFMKEHERVSDIAGFPAPPLEGPSTAQVLDSLMHADDGDDALALEARSPMRVIQARIITDGLDALLVDMHNQLLSIRNGGQATIAADPNVLRVVTHLALALRQMGVGVPVEATSAVVQAYIDLMTSAGYGSAVAIYAAELPTDLAMESMSRFLATVEELEDRKAYLRAARDNGLDTRILILRTVETIFQETLENVVPTNAGADAGADAPTITFAQADTAMTDYEARAINATGWLKLDDGLTPQTLTLGNALFRRLLLAGRVNAAKQLEGAMPDLSVVPSSWAIGGSSEEEEVAEGDDLEGEDSADRIRQAIEYVGHCGVARAFARYEAWKAVIRRRPEEQQQHVSGSGSVTGGGVVGGRRDPIGLRQWKSDVARLRADAVASLSKVLESDYADPSKLDLSPEDPVTDELHRIRTLYVPEAVLRLHGILAAQEGRDIPAAMELAVLVAGKLSEPMQRSGKLAIYVKELSLVGHYLT